MTRLIILSVLFLISVFFTGLATLPLGFVLDRSGLAGGKIVWSATQGTIWNGRVVGLTFQGQPYGDLRTRLRLQELTLGRLAFDVRLQSAGVRGLGIIRPVGFNAIEATDVQLELDLSALHMLDPRLRSVGGEIALQSSKVMLDSRGCVEAIGTASSDMLSRVAMALGQSWSSVSGELRCEAGALVVPLEGGGPEGELFSAQGKFGKGGSSIEARVSNADAALGYALGSIGFKLNNGEYTQSWRSDQATAQNE
jgi:general secretion pathway protein N